MRNGLATFCGHERSEDACSGGEFAPGLTFTLIYETGLGGNPCRWRFVLRSEEGHDELVAEDEEPGVTGERLELLTIVRALESLNQSSRVIIWTRSPAVREGFVYGLKEWPLHDWHWDCYDRLVPVKNRDLWQRIERATRYHRVECRIWRVDPPHVKAALGTTSDHAAGRFRRGDQLAPPIAKSREQAPVVRPLRLTWALWGLAAWFPRFGPRVHSCGEL